MFPDFSDFPLNLDTTTLINFYETSVVYLFIFLTIQIKKKKTQVIRLKYFTTDVNVLYSRCSIVHLGATMKIR